MKTADLSISWFQPRSKLANVYICLLLILSQYFKCAFSKSVLRKDGHEKYLKKKKGDITKRNDIKYSLAENVCDAFIYYLFHYEWL